MDLLLEHGANPNAIDHVSHHSSVSNFDRMLFLFQRGGNTLHAACSSEFPSRKIVLALLTKNADPTQLDIVSDI